MVARSTDEDEALAGAARALGDRLRVRILRRCDRAGAQSAAELGAELGLAPSRVALHVGELVRHGLLEGAGSERRAGAVERFYRPSPHARLLLGLLAHLAADERGGSWTGLLAAPEVGAERGRAARGRVPIA